MNRFTLFFVAFFYVYTAHAGSHAQPQAVTMPARHGHKMKSTITDNPTSSASLSSWELSGAIAAHNKQRGWTATLNWLQHGPNQYQIRLFGPLGGGTVIIEQRGSMVMYRDGKTKLLSRSPDALLQKKTGVRLPVKNLYYWVRGLTAPGSIQAEHRDANHYLVSFNQAGYSINYTGYTTANGIYLPSKIRLQGHGVLIKLVIKHWNVPS